MPTGLWAVYLSVILNWKKKFLVHNIVVVVVVVYVILRLLIINNNNNNRQQPQTKFVLPDSQFLIRST